ncbi:MAG: GIY-YIG nuclease family protein [Planctomycetota bacterium]
MPVGFNALLIGAGVQPAEVRLMRHQDTRSRAGSLYDVWRDERGRFEEYQAYQRVRNAKKFDAPYWASFVVDGFGDTVFVGLYRARLAGVLERRVERLLQPGVYNEPGELHEYDTALDSRLDDLIGRLVIDWGKSFVAWAQYADRQDKPILEIRAEGTDPAFPGFMDFRRKLSQLGGLPTTWRETLRSSRGVYLLACPRTREQYVGSATGHDGFMGRWLSYASDGHGGNVRLRSRDPSDYQVSILEVAGSAASTEDILHSESLWKNKLLSREMGLNAN